jgi:hypothetical protein
MLNAKVLLPLVPCLLCSRLRFTRVLNLDRTSGADGSQSMPFSGFSKVGADASQSKPFLGFSTVGADTAQSPSL